MSEDNFILWDYWNDQTLINFLEDLLHFQGSLDSSLASLTFTYDAYIIFSISPVSCPCGGFWLANRWRCKWCWSESFDLLDSNFHPALDTTSTTGQDWILWVMRQEPSVIRPYQDMRHTEWDIRSGRDWTDLTKILSPMDGMPRSVMSGSSRIPLRPQRMLPF